MHERRARSSPRSLEELRELARGIHPAVLDHGLAPGAHVAGGALGGADRGVRRPGRRSSRRAVELALYFVACEALANVAKYARATAASVRAVPDRRPGWRSRSPTTASVVRAASGGSGLRGLQDRVEALAGRLLVTSPPGAGTVVTRGGAVRVVIADDNLLMREGIAALVRRAGIEVVGEAGDGDALLRAVDEQRPDAAIVDVRMPPTHTDEGLRAAQEIRARQPADGHRDPLPARSRPGPRCRSWPSARRASAICSRTASRTSSDFAGTLRRVAAGGLRARPAGRVTQLLASPPDAGAAGRR